MLDKTTKEVIKAVKSYINSFELLSSEDFEDVKDICTRIKKNIRSSGQFEEYDLGCMRPYLQGMRELAEAIIALDDLAKNILKV